MYKIQTKDKWKWFWENNIENDHVFQVTDICIHNFK